MGVRLVFRCEICQSEPDPDTRQAPERQVLDLRARVGCPGDPLVVAGQRVGAR